MSRPIPPRLTGTAREEKAALLVREYDGGDSIRVLAARHGRSYGLVRALLLSGGAMLRGRGGVRPKRRPANTGNSPA